MEVEDSVGTSAEAAAVPPAMASTLGRDQQEPEDTVETTVPAAAETSTGGEIKK